ncbi:MAG: D-alanine--D-alanine ligase [Myxococcota bacterium]
MRLAILHNRDADVLEDDPGREAREDVERVASAVYGALTQAGHTVDLVPVERDLSAVTEALARRRPDVVVNLCESLNGDSRGEMLVPGLLDLLGVHYTGNTAFTLALALHKNKAKELLRARGVPTPEFWLVDSADALKNVDLPWPLIVKPSREDASVGIDFDSVVGDRKALARAVDKVRRTFKQPALVERFVTGREIYVPLLGHPLRPLPLTEIRFGGVFEGRPPVLTYRAKWQADSQECLDSPSVAAQLGQRLEARCVEVATAAFEALEGRDYGRVDLRVDDDGQPWVIDINPNCDLHPQAGFAKAALAAGRSYAELALHLVDLAWERRNGDQAARRSRPTAARRAAQPHRDLHAGRGGLRARAHRRGPAAE